MKKQLLIWVVLIALLLSGCSTGYNKLNDDQKQIIDAFYDNRNLWDVGEVEYGGKRTGEDVIRNIRFRTRDGDICLQVEYALDFSGSEIVNKYFVYHDGHVELSDTELAFVMGGTIGKSWYTSWSESEKKDYMAEKLIEYYQ